MIIDKAIYERLRLAVATLRPLQYDSAWHDPER